MLSSYGCQATCKSCKESQVAPNSILWMYSREIFITSRQNFFFAMNSKKNRRRKYRIVSFRTLGHFIKILNASKLSFIKEMFYFISLFVVLVKIHRMSKRYFFLYATVDAKLDLSFGIGDTHCVGRSLA